MRKCLIMLCFWGASCGGGGGTGDGGGGGDAAGGGDLAAAGDAGSIPEPACALPIQLLDVGRPTTVVGGCSEAELVAAVAKGGVITFDCGAAPATIPITAQIELPKGIDTTIDGGGRVTLDGGGKTRLFHFDGGDFRKTMTKITLQRITLAHGQSSGTTIPAAPPPCSQGTDVDGGGGAILVRDGVLHLFDVNFTADQAPLLGPDVAGGGVYAIGSIDTTIVNCHFAGDRASNGGAVGSLFSNLTLVNDDFTDNHAEGSGANYIDPDCMVRGGESGNGGNGGAVVIDGGETFAVTVCGCRFDHNVAGALGGAIFRTPDGGRAATHVDWTTFDGNQADHGGAAYFHHSDLHVAGTTFSHNSAQGSGAIQADDTVFDFTNVTFAGNRALRGLGGAFSLFGNGGTLTNCTFADNHADAGPGFFGAAIAGNTALTIRNSLFANNTSQDCGAPMACADGMSTGEADLQWPDSHLACNGPDTACATNTTFADPKLGPLVDQGGPTQTMAPAAGSPAIGLGKNCPAADQRGRPRKTPDGCTAGAYEAP
jgi:hypothetical protein